MDKRERFDNRDVVVLTVGAAVIAIGLFQLTKITESLATASIKVSDSVTSGMFYSQTATIGTGAVSGIWAWWQGSSVAGALASGALIMGSRAASREGTPFPN
jgi:hypothetical protein